MGEVILVGAGPGAADLITVRGLAAVRTADCLVYDRLVSDDLLREARADAARVYVGKASGCHSLPQDAINALLAEKARRYAKVVRLKGGDPFVFGRGGEEAAYLRGRGIRVRVVPGVTSAVAAPSAVGIPVTLRGVADRFTVINGHAPARTGETRIYLMGLARLADIVAALRADGSGADTPVAVIADATGRAQRCVTGTLADIAAKVAAAGLRSPATIVVGRVVECASS